MLPKNENILPDFIPKSCIRETQKIKHYLASQEELQKLVHKCNRRKHFPKNKKKFAGIYFVLYQRSSIQKRSSYFISVFQQNKEIGKFAIEYITPCIPFMKQKIRLSRLFWNEI